MANPSSLASRLEKVPVKVNKWNSQEVRVALDDLVAKYFVEEAGFQEVNSLLNWKLLFVILLTTIGGSTALYAYTVPFAQSRLYVGLGATAYLMLLGFYTLWLQYLITPTCFRGYTTQKGKTVSSSIPRKEIWVQSSLEMPSANYKVTLLDIKSGKPTKVYAFWNLGNFICENGQISGTNFCAGMEKFVKSDHFNSALKSD